MSIASVQLFSEGLGKRTMYNVILPEEGEGPFPVLIQLHGFSDDCNSWIQHSNLVRYAAAYPMVVVLPDGGTSRYLNLESGGRYGEQRYEDHIMRDISGHVRRHFNVTDGPWAIGGLSMGGYGGMRLGLKYPETFASIWAHSGSYRVPDIEPPFFTEFDDADIFRHADRLADADRYPVISFDCGVDDELLDLNRKLHVHLDTIGVAHHYAEHPGAHTWDYWDRHVREALEQHARVLGKKGKAN